MTEPLRWDDPRLPHLEVMRDVQRLVVKVLMGAGGQLPTVFLVPECWYPEVTRMLGLPVVRQAHLSQVQVSTWPAEWYLPKRPPWFGPEDSL